MSMNKTAIVFMADGMEMCECLITVDILRRAKVNVITASVMGRKEVRSSHQVIIYADVLAEEVDFDKADIIILPGGRAGTENLAESDIVQLQCRAFARTDGKYLAAICAAPSVPAALGILDGKKATCHPDFEEKVLAGSSINDMDVNSDGKLDIVPLVDLTHDSVTADGNIITGQGLGATMDFALYIAEILAGKDTADAIASSVCYRYR